MSRYDSSSRSGLSTWDVLLIVFIVLKLIGVINWGWGWVLAPLWIPVPGIFDFRLSIGLASCQPFFCFSAYG